MTSSRYFLLTVFLVIAALSACSSTQVLKPGAEKSSLPNVRLFDQTLALEDSGTYHYERGVLVVPENRSSTVSRTLELEFHRLPRRAGAPDSAPPIFLLKGGPGYEGIDAALDQPGYYEYFFQRFTDIADLIIVGQRGFGPSGSMPCPDLPPATITEVDTAQERHARLRKGLAVCRSQYESQGVDLSGYNVVEMSHDVADVAHALGYKNIQIMGNSFGSHWGMALIRHHPQLVSRITFSALEGPDHTFDNPREVERSLSAIAQAAQNAPALKARIGNRDLLAEFRALIKQADQSPIPVSFRLSEGESAQTVRLDGDALRQLSRGYSRGTHWRHLLPVWPLDMLTMLEGDLEGGMRRLATWWQNEELDVAGYYSVECGSGVSPQRFELLRQDANDSVLALHTLLTGDLCAGWPSELGPAFRAGFSSPIPALLIQGDWDTSTPPANAPKIRSMFANHHFVMVHGGSHGAMREAEEAFPQFRQAVLAWLKDGEIDQLPESVTLPELKWQTPE